MTAHAKRGFTVVELLVVIAIIGVLMAMLIPAVNAAREAARRGTCISHQSQIAKAVATYESSKNLMPSARSWPPNMLRAPPFYYGWVHPLLAELGEARLADRLFEEVDGAGNRLPGRPLDYVLDLPILMCPSDPPTEFGGGLLSYVVNGGRLNSNAGSTPINIPLDWPANGAFSDSLVDVNAPFHPTVKNSLSFISKNDGTSTTIMLSENLDVKSWIDVSQEPMQTILWKPVPDVLSKPNVGLNQFVLPEGSLPPQDVDHARPSSNHSGGFVMAFCDGSVKFVNENMQYTVYARMMTSAGAKTDTPGVAAAVDPLPTPLWQGLSVSQSDLE